MLASLYDPKIQRGGTFSIGVTAEDENASAMDFSVYNSMRLHVRPAWVGKPGSVTEGPLLTLTTANGGIVVATTLITITIPASVTETLSFNSGNYELEMIIDAVGGDPEVVDKLLYGTMYITGEVVV